jgi:hypothetical protein
MENTPWKVPSTTAPLSCERAVTNQNNKDTPAFSMQSSIAIKSATPETHIHRQQPRNGYKSKPRSLTSTMANTT